MYIHSFSNIKKFKLEDMKMSNIIFFLILRGKYSGLWLLRFFIYFRFCHYIFIIYE